MNADRRCPLTRLILVPPRDTVHPKLDHRVQRRQNKLEKHEPNNDWLRPARRIVRREPRVKAECFVQRGVVNKDGEDGEGEEEVGLRNEEELAGVRWALVGRGAKWRSLAGVGTILTVVPVPQLVTCIDQLRFTITTAKACPLNATCAVLRGSIRHFSARPPCRTHPKQPPPRAPCSSPSTCRR